jgi:hypothetical protein
MDRIRLAAFPPAALQSGQRKGAGGFLGSATGHLVLEPDQRSEQRHGGEDQRRGEAGAEAQGASSR